MTFLDIKTLSLVALLTAILLPLVLLMTGSTKPDDTSTRSWVRGAILYSVGFICLAGRGFLPDFITVVIANTLIFGGYEELRIGIRRFFQRPVSYRALSLTMPPFVLGILWFTYMVPSTAFRLALFSIYLLVTTLLVAWELYRAASEIGARTRAGTPTEQRLLLILAVVFALSGLILLGRASMAAMFPAETTDNPLLHGLNASAYFIAVIINFMVAASLPLLISQRTQRELEHSERLFSRAQELAQLGSLELNLRTREMTANVVIKRIFGIPEHAHLDYAAWVERIHPEDRPLLQRRVESTLDDKGAGLTNTGNSEYRIVRLSDGVIRWISAVVEVSPDPVDGSLLLLSTLRDITDSKYAAEAAQIALAAADGANRSKSEFLANMSHEIRTPLNGVIGMAQLLEHTTLTGEQSDYTRTIVSSAQSLLTIVNDILDFSKVEAGRLDIDPIPFHPAALLNDMRAIFTPQAKANGTALTVVSETPLPDLLVADASRLRQILSNLLGNAIKFTRDGQVSLTTRTVGTGNTVSGENLVLEFTVADSGIGMNAQTLAALFNPFFQADASITRNFGGTGLGLTIVKRLAELMGGSITVTSTLGQGSCFVLRLPFSVMPATVSPVTGHMTSDANGSSGRFQSTTSTLAHSETLTSPASDDLVTAAKTAQLASVEVLHILVVDDNVTNQTVAQHMVQRLGYEPTIASNGREALSLIEAQPFAAILMDCQMPVMDGYEATRRIRAGEVGERARTTPIIAMTANAMAADRQLCLEAGMDDFLPKPVVMDVLKAQLLRWSTGTHDSNRVPTESSLSGGTNTYISNTPVPFTQIDATAFEPANLLRYAMNDRSLALALVEAGLGDMATERQSLSSALASTDYAAANRHAHTLKGLSAQLGGEALAQRYGALEKGLRADADPAKRKAALDADSLAATEQASDGFCHKLRQWSESS